MGFTGIFALAFGVALLVGALWVSLFWQARRAGWLGVLGKLALQVSALLLVWGLVRGHGALSLLTAAIPPLAVLGLDTLLDFPGLLAALAPYALPPAILAQIAAFFVPRLRIWSPSLTVITGAIAAILAAGPVVDNRMCQTAADRGETAITRNSFVFSLTHAPREFQFKLHGLITIDNQPWGWSYRQMDWYPIPPSAAGNVLSPTHPLTCPASVRP